MIYVSLDIERTGAVKEILADIRRRLQGAEYRCEEHGRLARLLDRRGPGERGPTGAVKS